MIVFLEVTPRWPVDAEPIRACSAAHRRAQTWNGQKWAGAVYDPGSLAVSLFNGEIGSEVESSTAPIVLTEKHLLKLFPDAKSVRWENARFRMWAGDFVAGAADQYMDYVARADPYLSVGGNRIMIGGNLLTMALTPDAKPGLVVSQVAQGKVSRFEKDGGAIKLSLDPAGEAGETNVLALEYAGTGGAEGGADLKGKLKPWIFGHAKNVEPVLINEDDSVYQFSGYGPIQSVDALYERGASFGAATGDYANYAALVAVSIPAGRWATCLAEGMIRLGAPQYGLITGDVKGDYSGSVQKRKPGAILQRIASYRGISADAIDGASLAALDAFAATLPGGGNINLLLSDQTTFLDLARRLAGDFNAQAGFTLMGRLIFTRVEIGTPEFTIHSQGRFLPLVGSFVEADTPAPYKRIVMSGDISWRVHDLANDIAFYATPLERGVYDNAETYREGNIVSIGDGSRWIYTNPVASIGNLPADGSSYWERLSAAATGPTGPSGVSNAVVQLYKRGATSPSAPSGTFTYTFSSGVLSGGTLNGWSQTVPAADGNPLWVIAATASANTATDTVTAAEFSSPVLKDGAGLNSATVFLYKRGASSPGVPSTTTTYTFSTGILSGTLDGWAQSVPANDGNPVWIITATALSATATDTIATGEWAAPQVLAANGDDGADGNDGADGDTGPTGNKTVRVYKRSGAAPSTPTGDAPPSGWSFTIPTDDGTAVWASDVETLANGTTAVGSYTTPVLFQAATPVAGNTTIVLDDGDYGSPSITRFIPNGGAIPVSARLRTLLAAVSGTQYMRLEWRVVGGSWATLGTEGSGVYIPGEFAVVSQSETFTNSSGEDQNYEFRAFTRYTGSYAGVEESRSHLTA